MNKNILIVLGVCALILFMGCSSDTAKDKTGQDTKEIRATVTRTLPANVRGGENFTVSLTMVVNGSLNAVGLEETYPSGWIVSSIAPKGVLKNGPDRIEWLFWPFGEPIMNRTINYTITAPYGYSGPAAFSGKVMATTNYPIEGNSSVNVLK
jgi:hypothetical protein